MIGLVEIENQATLNDLAARVNQDTVDAGLADPQCVGYLEEGNDIGGIDVAFLVKATKITVLSIMRVRQVGHVRRPERSERRHPQRPPAAGARSHGAAARTAIRFSSL